MKRPSDPERLRPILALIYTDGHAADRFLADLGYGLRDAGRAVAGIVQRNTFLRDPIKCDMEVEELASGTILQLSQFRGLAARGCQLDRAALAEAAGLLVAAIDAEPDILVLNKFGRTEAEGGGLRDALGRAAEFSIPTIVGVPYRNLDCWRSFAGDLAHECEVDPEYVRRWLGLRGVALGKHPRQLTGSDSPAVRQR